MAEENEDMFQKIGVDVSNDKIKIDLTKTKDFFNSLNNTLQEKSQTIQKDISEGKIDLGENVGIEVDNEHIDIDLAKIKNFIEDFGKKIESFLDEIDKTVDEIGKK